MDYPYGGTPPEGDGPPCHMCGVKMHADAEVNAGGGGWDCRNRGCTNGDPIAFDTTGEVWRMTCDELKRRLTGTDEVTITFIRFPKKPRK